MADNTLMLVIVLGLAVSITAVILTVVGTMGARRRRRQLEELRPLPASLRNDIAPNGDRWFYEGGELYYVQIMKRRLKRLPGAAVLKERIDSHQVDWEIRFAYKGYEFEIQMCHHYAGSQYFVSDPSCPDALLCEVARYFDRDL